MLILGLDVSKGYGDFVLLNAERQVLEPRFRLDDTAAGHQQLAQSILKWKKQYQAQRVLLVAESTGAYEDNWLRLAKRSSLSGFLETYRINPKIIHHEYRTQRRQSIDDGVSALTIAEHVAKNLDQFSPALNREDQTYAPARILIRHYARLDQEATRHKNALSKLIYQYFPSLEALKPSSWPAYWLDIFAQYGSRKSIQIAASNGFKQLKWVPKAKAKEIAKTLAQGIDPRETPPLVVLSIQSKARQIKQLHQEIKAIQDQLIKYAPVDPQQVQLLQSIKGMGTTTPIILLCYIEQVDRFENAKKMAAFFGLNPRIKQSGDGAYKTKISKQGAAIVRKELYLLAFRTLQHEPYLKSIYLAAIEKGLKHDAALGVLMHKLGRIIYGMLKEHKKFDPGIDQINQLDNRTQAPISSAKKTDRAQRFQAPSLSAPISRRERAQRKKDYASQAAIKTENAGST